MKNLQVFIARNPLMGRCPDCNDLGSLHRSRSRNLLERIVKNTSFFKIYRCRSCGWRGFRSTYTLTRESLKTLALYFALMALTALVLRFVLTKFLLK